MLSTLPMLDAGKAGETGAATVLRYDQQHQSADEDVDDDVGIGSGEGGILRVHAASYPASQPARELEAACRRMSSGCRGSNESLCQPARINTCIHV